MSRRRQGARFSRYSLSPERSSRRVSTTSLNGIGSSPSLFSKCSDTSAMFTALRADEPWKITSSIFAPRMARARCSPSTQRTASETFDLPLPFGPDDRGHAALEQELGVIGKRLESMHLELRQPH